jgi:hypothetical protein
MLVTSLGLKKPHVYWRSWNERRLRVTIGVTLRKAAHCANSPTQRVRELWCVAGRRSGKSRIAAAVAVYLALFVQHRLAKGERGMCLVIAGSVDQARMVFNYIRGFLEAAPALEREVAAVKRSEIELKNGIVIAVHSNSFRTVRGRTLVAAILDEVSFWRDETTATPDVEVYRALLPSLATTDGMLIGISTPYRRLGLLHQKHRDHFGVDDDNVLVVQGASTVFNPSLSDAVIAAQRTADPTAAGAEWDAEFRSDISSFLDDELIDRAVEQSRPLELPPADGVLYAALCKEYCVVSVTGDAYAREWVAATWRETGITYQQSELVKSEIYLETIPLFARGLVRLPDHARLLRELRALERHTHRSGKDSVDHPRNGRDDHANAVCGALHMIGRAPIGLAAITIDAWVRILHDVSVSWPAPLRA